MRIPLLLLLLVLLGGSLGFWLHWRPLGASLFDALYMTFIVDDPAAEPKLIRAGADRAIDLYTLGGRRLAQSVIRPAAIDFFTDTLGQRHVSSVEELLVPAGSSLAGRSLRDLELRSRIGASVIALLRGGSSFANPEPGLALAEGDLLIVLGDPEQLEALRRLAESGG